MTLSLLIQIEERAASEDKLAKDFELYTFT